MFEPRYDLDRAGGAYVRRRFTLAGREAQIGETISLETLRSLKAVNRRALVNTGRIELFPSAPATAGDASAFAGAENHLIHLGAGKYHVVRGVLLTQSVVSREEAEEIATRPENVAQ